MMDYLRDSIWQFVGAIFGLIAIIISIGLFRIQHQRKNLSIEIIHNAYLVRPKDEIKDKLKILFEKKPVENLLLLIVRIVNTGNVPILTSDYDRPISVKSPKGKILISEVVETSPKNLDVSLEVDSERVMIMPILLNQGDSITLKVLVNAPSELHFDKNVVVEGRIVGVRNIKKTDPSLKGYLAFTAPRLLLLSGIFFVFVFMISVAETEKQNTPAIVSFFFFASNLTLAVSSWVWWSITKEAQRLRGIREMME